MSFKKQQFELGMKHQTGSKQGKEYVKYVYCQPAYLTYMQRTPHKMPGWMKYKPESRLLGEISMQMTSHPYDRKQSGTKQHLSEGEKRMKKLA